MVCGVVPALVYVVLGSGLVGWLSMVTLFGVVMLFSFLCAQTVVPDVAGGLTEEKIGGKAFELVFAFDEVITTGGHKENITLQQASLFMCNYFSPCRKPCE